MLTAYGFKFTLASHWKCSQSWLPFQVSFPTNRAHTVGAFWWLVRARRWSSSPFPILFLLIDMTKKHPPHMYLYHSVAKRIWWLLIKNCDDGERLVPYICWANCSATIRPSEHSGAQRPAQSREEQVKLQTRMKKNAYGWLYKKDR